MSNLLRQKPKMKSFILALLITLIFFIIKNDKILINKNFGPIFRLLYKEAEHEQLCYNAEGDLDKKYSKNYVIKKEDHKLTNLQTKIIDKMREKKGAKDGIKASIKSFLPRIWVFIFFLALIIIFIACWVFYLCITCCDCKCWRIFIISTDFYKLVIFLLALLLSFAALVLNILILVNISSLMSYANGFGCALFNVFRQIFSCIKRLWL